MQRRRPYGSKVGGSHACDGTPATIALAGLDNEFMRATVGPRVSMIFARHFGRWVGLEEMEVCRKTIRLPALGDQLRL